MFLQQQYDTKKVKCREMGEMHIYITGDEASDSELRGDSRTDNSPIIVMFKTTAEPQPVCSTNQSMEEDFD
jgi:hypothetical protein